MPALTETVKWQGDTAAYYIDVSPTNENLMYHFTSDSNETKCRCVSHENIIIIIIIDNNNNNYYYYYYYYYTIFAETKMPVIIVALYENCNQFP